MVYRHTRTGFSRRRHLWRALDRFAQTYRFGGEYDSKALFVEGFVGVTDWFDLGVQIFYFDQTFTDDTRLDTPSASGWSDLLFSKTRLLQNFVHLTMKLGAKIPTGEFQ